MKDIKWISLLFAILTTACMVGIGVEIAEKSLIGVVVCIIAVILIMGLGFMRKRKLRENGEL